MSIRRFVFRTRDIGASLACVAGAPVVGAVMGAVGLTVAMSVIAFFVITDTHSYEGDEDLEIGRYS